MKEELQEKLVEILTSIQNATGKAADFAVAELPDVAQQYLIFGRIYESFFMAAFVILFVVCAFLSIKVYKDFDKELVIAPVIFSAFFLFLSLSQIKETLLVWVAPKVWLITELAKLIK